MSTANSSAAAGAMEVTPRTVAPGGVVSLRLQAACQAGKKARASAGAFVDSVTLAPAADGHGLQGSAFIKSDAADGSYAISVDCGGVTSSAAASVTVTAGAAGAAGAAGTAAGQDQQQTADHQQAGDHQLAPDQAQTGDQQAGDQALAPDQQQAGDPQQAGDQALAPDQQQAGDQPQAPDHQLTPDHPQTGDHQLTPDQPNQPNQQQTGDHLQAQDHQTPVKPVPAGGGGTAQLAAGPAAAGTSTGPLLATGGFLVLGLAGLAIHRRRGATRG